MTTLLRPEIRDVWDTYLNTLRPDEPLSPAEFSARYRKLHEIYCSERPGPWDNTVYPYQPLLMNLVQEAIETGKRGVAVMKAGQIGGTDCMINALLWLKKYYPGPQLFMTSTEKVAQEFGRERFEPIIRDMPPLAVLYRPSRRGEILVKRFVDGKIQLSGGQSVFNLQSTPYRFVMIDELDSLSESLGGSGDPLKLAEVRTDSFSGETLIIAYAHPSTRDRGVAKLYYEQSDQRRGHVRHRCGSEYPLAWEDVKCTGEKTNPAAYERICPQCGAVIEDAELILMLRRMTYKSTLPPEQAAWKSWIGAQASQMMNPAKTTRMLAERWIACGDDENAVRVFFNKILGEPYEIKQQKVEESHLRRLIVVSRRRGDPEYYVRGQVPPMVRFLTAGQDSRTTELHYSIWGWGLRRGVDQTVSLCGWLIDWGCIARQYSLTFAESEYHVFDDLIYNRRFLGVDGRRHLNVMACGHDIGYQPTQIPLIRYCRNFRNRAIPVKGASEDASSACRAPYARWGAALRFKAGETEALDATSRALLLNTYMLKNDWYGWTAEDRRIEIPDVAGQETVGSRRVYRLALPEDVDDLFIRQSSNEQLVAGKRKGELVWKKKGPNHFADTNTYALGLALNLDPFQKNQTAEEAAARQRPEPPSAAVDDSSTAPERW